MPYTFPKPEHPASALSRETPRCPRCNGWNQRAPYQAVCDTCRAELPAAIVRELDIRDEVASAHRYLERTGRLPDGLSVRCLHRVLERVTRCVDCDVIGPDLPQAFA